jgi:hypothetical protein
MAPKFVVVDSIAAIIGASVRKSLGPNGMEWDTQPIPRAEMCWCFERERSQDPNRTVGCLWHNGDAVCTLPYYHTGNHSFYRGGNTVMGQLHWRQSLSQKSWRFGYP